MQLSDAIIVREEISVAQVNQLLREGWKVLAVVPGYDHMQAQPAACYILGMEGEPVQRPSVLEIL
jgi:hypothetical protein